MREQRPSFGAVVESTFAAAVEQSLASVADIEGLTWLENVENRHAVPLLEGLGQNDY